MATMTDARSMQDWIDQLGGVAPRRILTCPPLGAATEADLIAVNEKKRTICELVDGVLVEKPMGIRESLLAAVLIGLLREYLKGRKLGFVTAPDGAMRLTPGLVRVPDVAFTSWDRVPERRVPTRPLPDLAPDLAIEVLSAGNTAAEMERKTREYLEAGVTFVWLVDLEARTITIHDRDRSQPRVYGGSETIILEKVLPGFRLELAELFAELDEPGPPTEEPNERPSS